MARGVLLLAMTALLSCPTVWAVSKAFTNTEMLAQVPTRFHLALYDLARNVHARLPPGGVQGWRACVHTPSRVAPPVGRHQLPQGSSTHLRTLMGLCRRAPVRCWWLLSVASATRPKSMLQRDVGLWLSLCLWHKGSVPVDRLVASLVRRQSVTRPKRIQASFSTSEARIQAKMPLT